MNNDAAKIAEEKAKAWERAVLLGQWFLKLWNWIKTFVLNLTVALTFLLVIVVLYKSIAEMPIPLALERTRLWWVVRSKRGTINLKARTWHGNGDIRCESVPDPRIEDGHDAIIKVTACAICGSDAHFRWRHHIDEER